MTESLSIPIETLIQQLGLRPEADQSDADAAHRVLANRAHCDVLIIGSGYGGAIAAARFAGARDRTGEPLRVLVLERGREYSPGDYPETLGDLPGHIGILGDGGDQTAGYHDGLFDLRLGAGQSILVANGLGGGSLINAGVALPPPPRVLDDPCWPSSLRRDRDAFTHAIDRAATLLGAAPLARRDLPPKFSALARVGAAMGASCAAAPVTVRLAAGADSAGRMQPACTACGQCVTGCNVGAKRTLTTTALPLAAQRGAMLCTGATVLTISPLAGPVARWRVRLRRTASERSPMIEEVYTLRARVVVLSAGTLGSTEILLRSREAGLLPCSEMLGRRFGGNGDVIAATFGEATPVHAVARGPSDEPPVRVGPTITGWVRHDDAEGRVLTIEDGAIPWPLARFFGEIVTTGSLLRRFTDDRLADWSARHPQADPAAVHPGAVDRSQVFLVMRSGHASGTLELIARSSACVPEPATLRELDRRRIAVVRRCGHDEQSAVAVDRLLGGLEDDGHGTRADAFDGGQYLANPGWRALPAGFGDLPGLAAAPGALVTVHPLGGCVMGEDAARGVVDHAGAVFDPSDGAQHTLHPGLYVLDGSIVPMALGTNPLLTIAALAWRGCTQIARREGWHALDGSGAAWRPALPRWPELLGQAAAIGDGDAALELPGNDAPRTSRTVSIDIEERLTSVVDPVPPQLRGVIGSAAAMLELRVSIRIDDVDAWLADARRDLPARCELSGVALDARRERWVNAETTAPGKRDDLRMLAKGWGTVRLLQGEPLAGGPGGDLGRLRALAALLGRRGPEMSRLLFRRGDERRAADVLAGFWRVAGVHTFARTMDYTLDLYPAATGVPWGLMRLVGRKRIRYAPHEGNPWTALTTLPSTLVTIAGAARHSPADRAVGIDWSVDVVDMSERFFAQVRRSPDTAESAGAMISLGAMFARSLLAAHFWSFAGLAYPRVPIRRSASLPAPQRLLHGRVEPQVTYFSAPLRPGTAPRIELRLTRFARVRAQPVLLVHGLAHSSRLFHTPTVRPNLVESLLEAEFDVWLLDHRLSIDLPFASYLPGDLDTIARFDIAQAVDIVHQVTGSTVHLVAHCVGAGAAAMSVLGGHCQIGGAAGRGDGKLRSIVLHAFTPWVEPSIANRIRANVAGYVKDMLRIPGFPAVLPDEPRAHDQLIDRIASSLPLARAADRHVRNRSRRAREIRNRMTLFYGTEYNHENLASATHRDIVDFSGFGNLAAFKQIHQCARQGRITDRQGRDVYLDPARFERYWRVPTLFCAGIDNRVFSHLGARRSARNLDRIRGLCAANERDVYLFEAPGTGHLDFIMGRHAGTVPSSATSIHGILAGFLRDPASIGARPGVYHGDVLRDLPTAGDESCPPLRAGPVLRDARVRGAGSVEIDVWAEIDERAPVAPVIEFVRRRDGRTIMPIRLHQVPVTHGRYLRATLLLTRCDDLVIRLRYRDAAAGPDTIRDHRLALAAQGWFRRLWQPAGRSGVAIAVGSCLHGGAPFERTLADGAFELMQRHLRGDAGLAPIDRLLLVGDQIYADATAGVFGDGQDDLSRYVERYRKAFTQPAFASMMAAVPTHFALDDHEFVNNWPGQAPRGHPLWRSDAYQRDIAQFRRARRYAVAYQGAALPASERDLDRQVFWHEFESGGCPFFVMDSRTERVLRSGHTSPERWSMIGEAQRRAFEDWARRWEDKPVPMFVVFGSPLVPIPLELYRHPELAINVDGWMGYPAAVDWIARQVLQRPGRFVLIAGDLHLSAAAEVVFGRGEKQATAIAIIASGLFSPWPFANADPSSLAWRPASPFTVPGTGTDCHYRATLLSTDPRQFTRVDAVPLETVVDTPLQRQHSGAWCSHAIAGWEIRVQTFSAPIAPTTAPATPSREQPARNDTVVDEDTSQRSPPVEVLPDSSAVPHRDRRVPRG